MRANEFLNEAKLGVEQNRLARLGSREDTYGKRGHKEKKGFNNNEAELDEAGKADKALCISKKTDAELGASQLSSCKAQGLRKRDTNRKFKTGGSDKPKSIKGKRVKSSDYGGPLPKWKGN